MLLKLLRILIPVMYFKDRNWISKTLNCIIYLVVCEIVFCSKFSDIPDNAEEREGEEGEEEHRQLQSITRFTQTQLYKGKQTAQLFWNRKYIFSWLQNYGN